MHTAIHIITMGSVVFALAACGNARDANKRNFSQAIQASLDTQNGLCAGVPAEKLPFTLTSEYRPDRRNEQADALVDAGLLTKRETEVKALFGEKMVAATEYQITDSGKKYHVADAGAFCTGKLAIVEVGNFTEPSEMMGVKMTQANYRYKVKDVADWAKSEKLRTAYPDFASKTRDEVQDQATLILTNDGWVHERLFQR